MAALNILGIGDEQQPGNLLGIPGATVLDISPPTQRDEEDPAAVQRRDALAALYNNVTGMIRQARGVTWDDVTGFAKSLLPTGQSLGEFGAGGMNAWADRDIIVPEGAQKVMLDTGPAYQMPDGTYKHRDELPRRGAVVPLSREDGKVVASMPGVLGQLPALGMEGGGTVAALKGAAREGTEGVVLRTFGGVRAKNADLDALKWAQTMDKDGKATRQAIWEQTGWFKDPVSGRWLNEISDDAAKYQTVRHPVTGEDTWQDFTKPHPDTTYDRLVHHPELMAAYPQVSETRLSFGKDMPGYGGMHYPPPLPGMPSRLEYPGLDLPRLPLMGHETQHAVQAIEGLPRGGNLTDAFHDDALKPYLIEEKNRIVKELMTPESFEKFQESRGRLATPELYEKYVAAKKQPVDWTKPYAQEIWNDAARAVYRRLSGEAQARLTEKRWFMTPEERRARPPWQEYDVPTWQQIVRDPMFPMKKAAQGSGE
jgi:Large polyvalent protein associated domain 23